MKKESKIKILLAGEKYRNDIKVVGRKTWLATYPNEEFGITKRDILDFWKARRKLAKKSNTKKISSDNVKKWVAIIKGKVVGYCSAEKQEKYNEIHAIYILPKYQGLGIGKKLINKGIKWLGNKQSIRVWVVSYNKKAISFYKKQGFSNYKRIKAKPYNLLDGKYMPEIVLIKKPRKYNEK